MNKLQHIIRERPRFHKSETEIERAFDPSESLLPHHAAAQLASGELTCYGIEPEVLSFIADRIGEESRTLETGAGCSTLVFALCGSDHIAITPSQSEIKLITEYAAQKQISLSNVQFINQSSDRCLPQFKNDRFDLVLLDGKHAFPWPIIDWFFTAEQLRQGGIMIIDDVHLQSVGILAEFLKSDPGWELIRDFSAKTFAFRKTRESIHDVAWHMQPFTIAQRTGNKESQSLLRRIARRMKKLAQNHS